MPNDTALKAFPSNVRAQAAKMREFMKTIENAPLSEVVKATNQLNAEIGALVSLVNEVEGRRI